MWLEEAAQQWLFMRPTGQTYTGLNLLQASAYKNSGLVELAAFNEQQHDKTKLKET